MQRISRNKNPCESGAATPTGVIKSMASERSSQLMTPRSVQTATNYNRASTEARSVFINDPVQRRGGNAAAAAATQPRRNLVAVRQTALVSGRRVSSVCSAQAQTTRAGAGAGVGAEVGAGVGAIGKKAKMQLGANRGYPEYGRKNQKNIKKKQPVEVIDINVPIGPVQVVTQPKRVLNTPTSFFVPLNEEAKSRDFQLLCTAGERYIVKLLRCKVAQERENHEMAELVAATRSLVPEWQWLEENATPPSAPLPPPQFADDNVDEFAWRYRMQRNDTVTLCNFPTWERKLPLREYAARLSGRNANQ